MIGFIGETVFIRFLESLLFEPEFAGRLMLEIFCKWFLAGEYFFQVPGIAAPGQDYRQDPFLRVGIQKDFKTI